MTAVVRKLLIALVRLLVGAHARWEGCAPEPRQRIYFANHASHLDTLVIIAELPADLRRRVHPVAVLDYWGRSRFRRFLAVDYLAAERVICEWVDSCNNERPHSALAGRTPVEAYGAGQPVDLMHIPTGSTTAAGRDKQDSGGMIRQPNTP